MSNIYIIAHYKILSIINLVLFLSFREIINLLLSSSMYTIQLFINVISDISFYHFQYHFLINNDIRATCFSLSIVYILIIPLILCLTPLVRPSLFITRPSISYCSIPM